MGINMDMTSQGLFKELFKQHISSSLRARYDTAKSASSKHESRALSLPVAFLISKYAITDQLSTTLPISNKGLEFFIQQTLQLTKNLLEADHTLVTSQQKTAFSKNWLIQISTLLSHICNQIKYELMSFDGKEEIQE